MNEWEGDLNEDSDQPPQSTLLPSSRKLAVSWTSSSIVRRIRQTWEDRWFLECKICVINSITKTYGLFSKLFFGIHKFNKGVLHIHEVFLFSLDRLNLMTKNSKRQFLGGDEMNVFHAYLYFAILSKYCTLNICCFDLRCFHK